MENQSQRDKSGNTDEIDIGQLVQLVKDGIESISRGFLRLFVYLKRKVVILLGLLIGGLIIGFILNQVITETYKIEVIAKPNLESKDYLYDAVEEIQANLRASDTAFFKNIGIDMESTKGFRLEIKKLEAASEGVEDEMAYLELLLSTDNAALLSDVVRAEIMNRSSFSHRITFFFKDPGKGPEFARRIMAYINSNDYFQQVSEINIDNAERRIEENKQLIDQIDKILDNYSEKLEQGEGASDGRIVLQAEDGLDVPGLLSWKSKLIKENEDKKLEMLSEQEPVTILNFGRSQKVQKQFFGNTLYVVPLALVLLFFLWEWFRYLDRRAREKQIH